MPSKAINLQPNLLDLFLYAGDGARLKLKFFDKDGAPIDITGTVKAQIRPNRDFEVDPLVEFDANMIDAYQGIVVISLTGDQTFDLVEKPSGTTDLTKFTGVWDVEWHPSGDEPRTICQGNVECVIDVTR